jgi:hypothetical protein
MKKLFAVAPLVFGLCFLATHLPDVGARPVDAQIASLGPGAIIFADSRSRLNSLFVDYKVVTRSGVQVNGHCEWHPSLDRNPAELPIAELQLAANPSTCKEVVKIGHVLGGPPPEWGGSSARSPVVVASR